MLGAVRLPVGLHWSCSRWPGGIVAGSDPWWLCWMGGGQEGAMVAGVGWGRGGREGARGSEVGDMR